MHTKIPLINDETGTFWYSPEVFSRDQLSPVFETLKDDLQWEQPIVKLYGKICKPDRKIYGMADPDAIPYSFSGDCVVPHAWHPAVKEIKEQIEDEFNTPSLNFALLNLYPHGKSYLGYHSDSEKDMVKNTPIIGLVLGNGRDFLVKPITALSKEKRGVLKHFVDVGDVFAMEKNFQHNYQHSVPKRAKGSERISITFRCMKTKKQ